MIAQGRAHRLLTARGLLRVRVCLLCAGLVVADGARQHEKWHTAAWPTDPRRADDADASLTKEMRNTGEDRPPSQ